MNVIRLAYKTQHFQCHPAVHVAPDMLKILAFPAIKIAKWTTNEQKDQKKTFYFWASQSFYPRIEKNVVR